MRRYLLSCCWLILLGALFGTGCERTVTRVFPAWGSDRPRLAPSERVTFERRPESGRPRWRVCVASIRVRGGTALGRFPGSLPLDETLKEAKILAVEAPFEVIGTASTVPLPVESGNVRRFGLGEGESVHLVRRQPFVFPRRYSTGGKLYQTLTNEDTGYAIHLTLSQVSESGARVEVGYEESQLETYRRDAAGNPLPVLRRESLAQAVTLAEGEVLVFGSQRHEQSRTQLFRRKSEIWFERWAVWLVPASQG